jgi:flavodoxin
MTELRCLILVKSVHHGNTAQVARELADVLGADVAAPEEIPCTSLDQYGLVGIGSGVYYGRMHEVMLCRSLSTNLDCQAKKACRMHARFVVNLQPRHLETMPFPQLLG